MARRKTSVTRRKSGNTEIVVVEPPTTPSAPTKRRRGRTRRRGGGGGGGVSKAAKSKSMLGAAIGGLGYGMLEKYMGEQIPSLPLLGKSGTIAAVIYFAGGKNDIINDIGIAAAAIAGYSLGKEGRITGE